MEAAKVTPSGVCFGSTAAAGASASSPAAATTAAIASSDRRWGIAGRCRRKARRPAMAKTAVTISTVVRPMPIQPRNGRTTTV